MNLKLGTHAINRHNPKKDPVSVFEVGPGRNSSRGAAERRDLGVPRMAGALGLLAGVALDLQGTWNLKHVKLWPLGLFLEVLEHCLTYLRGQGGCGVVIS